LKDTLAQLIEVPAGLAEEAVKGAVVFEAVELSGLNDVSERTPTGTENPSAGDSPERGKTGLGKAGLEGEQQRSKRAEQEVWHRRLSQSFMY
jgi:hypothetical protein